MSDASGDYKSAVAAGVLASEEQFGRLLRSIVEVARAIFGAKASSVFLFDEETDELVFAAVAGDDEQHLVGKRLPSSTGIAGWVLSSRTPLVLDDVQQDPRFAREVAEGTGYVPQGLMAVPLLDDERVLGVLQVLDRPQRERFSRCRRWSCSACSPARPRSRLLCSAPPGAPVARSRARETPPPSPRSPRRSSRSKATGAPRRQVCSAS